MTSWIKRIFGRPLARNNRIDKRVQTTKDSINKEKTVLNGLVASTGKKCSQQLQLLQTLWAGLPADDPRCLEAAREYLTTKAALRTLHRHLHQVSSLLTHVDVSTGSLAVQNSAVLLKAHLRNLNEATASVSMMRQQGVDIQRSLHSLSHKQDITDAVLEDAMEQLGQSIGGLDLDSACSQEAEELGLGPAKAVTGVEDSAAELSRLLKRRIDEEQALSLLSTGNNLPAPAAGVQVPPSHTHAHAHAQMHHALLDVCPVQVNLISR